MTGEVPIQAAIQERGVAPGPFVSRLTPDQWFATLAALPLVHQPGEDWLYNTGSDVIGVLIERLTGQTLETLFRERIFEPLGMTDTGFSVRDEAVARFATGYRTGDGGGMEVADPARASAWSGPSPFRSRAGGLVSTIPDYLRFARMLHHGGELDGVRIVGESSVREVTRDQVTAEEKNAWPSYRVFQGPNGWGYGVSVTLEKGPFGHAAGTYGWTGGWNTHWCNDPASDLIGLVFFQRLMTGPHDMEASGEFWRLAYECLGR
jgi:CubicO group peptidase (beta-lactamase class C family)